MYLKSIEVQGFKSFANKIVFEFHQGITGIVGPNGSGKSNVADAVRWVLGEQSVKQLRGSSMQDVIFAGTENRKPLSYAYVAITLDNSDHKLAIDYEEVTVARRLYRSGESEYLINGSPCRLKEVSELFYDTGIGKEGYSIIGQGQIDRILSGKPEERRELFDEAAGIVKFKKRKATAQKKLENERDNLIRVNDILSELERQVEPLQLQSEKAKTYLKKKNELKDYDVNMFLMETERIASEQREVEEFFAKGQKGSSAMPHKRNPIGSENMTGLARVIRGHMVTAYENVSLWHERDISHSSAERIIAPDTTILVDYMLNRFGNIVKNLTVFPENMKRNMGSTFGLIFSQRAMLTLIEKGMTREQAYDLVQPKTAQSWDNQVDFKPLLEADPEITSRLSQEEIDEIFNPVYYTKRVDEIFDRIGLGD